MTALLVSGVGKIWDNDLAFQRIQTLGLADTRHDAVQLLVKRNFLPPDLEIACLVDEFERPVRMIIAEWAIRQALHENRSPFFARLYDTAAGKSILYLNNQDGDRFWMELRNRYLDRPSCLQL